MCVQFNSDTIEFRMGGVSRLCISGFMRTCVFHMERMNQNITTFVAELLMNIYFPPSSGDNMDFDSYWIGYH